MKYNIYDLIDKHEIISFDIFDTLLVRNVLNPSDIFELVEKKYNTLHKDYPINGFKNNRIKAEKLARLKKKNEIIIYDIYRQIDYPDYIKNELMSIEMDEEFKYTINNPNVFSLYHYSKEKGKKIIITSDMYLPKAFIARILKNCGIDTYNELFVSSDSGFRKRTGELFVYISNYLKCNSNDILHIGDNKISDYIMPLKNGFDAYLIHPNDQNLYHLKKSKYNFNLLQNNVAAAIIRNYSCSKKECEKIGCQIMGLPLVGFCQWIHERTHDVDKFFLARDGYLIKKAYEILYPEEKNKCHYLYLSRKSLRIPNIYSGIKYEYLVEQFPNLKEYNVKIFCDLINLDEDRQSKYIQMFRNTAVVKKRSELAKNNDYKYIFNKIKEEEKLFFEKQYKIFLKYLQQMHFYGKVAVIDVGWRATAQINISNLLGKRIRISGYYFGVEPAHSNNNSEYNSINGYYWGWNDNNKIRHCILNGRKSLFEIMFLSSEGTTLLYSENNGLVSPILDNNNNIGEESCSIKIQNGALDFVRSYKKYIEELPVLSSRDTYMPLLDFMLYPNITDMTIGDSICENYRKIYLAKPKSIFIYIKSPKMFFKDLKNSEWKVGFISRLIHPIRPIQSLLNYLYEIMRKE